MEYVNYGIILHIYEYKNNSIQKFGGNYNWIYIS